MQELVSDISDLPDSDQPVTVVHPCGSGGTAAGLILGAKLSDLPFRIASINVSDDRDYFVKVVGDICEKAIADYRLDVAFDRGRDVEIIDGYVGRGYALSRPEELKLICEMARTEGIFLDPVYTGKAFYGMLQELKRDRGVSGNELYLFTPAEFSDCSHWHGRSQRCCDRRGPAPRCDRAAPKTS